MNVIRQRSNDKITTAGSSSLATWVVASFPLVFMYQKPRGRWHNCLQAECTSPNQPCRRIKRNWKHGPQQEKLTTGFIIPWSTDGLAFLLNAVCMSIFTTRVRITKSEVGVRVATTRGVDLWSCPAIQLLVLSVCSRSMLGDASPPVEKSVGRRPHAPLQPSPRPMTRHNSIDFQNRISDCRAHETASFSHHYQYFLSHGIN